MVAWGGGRRAGCGVSSQRYLSWMGDNHDDDNNFAGPPALGSVLFPLGGEGFISIRTCLSLDRLCIVPLGTVPLDFVYVELISARPQPVLFRSALLCFVRFGPIRFGSVLFGSVLSGSVWFGSVRFGPIRITLCLLDL